MKNTLLTILLFFYFISLGLSSTNLTRGQWLFKGRCAACHGISNELTGPALAGISDRRSEDWIVAFVRSPQQMISEGDQTALEVFDMYNSLPMPPQKDLSDNDIRDIIAYIGVEAQGINASTKQQKYLAGTAVTSKKFLKLDDTSTLLKVGITTLLVPLLLFGCFCYQKSESVTNK